MTQYTSNNVDAESGGSTQFRKKKEELEVGALITTQNSLHPTG